MKQGGLFMSECIGEAEVGAGGGGGRSSHNKCHCESRKNPQLTSSLVPLLTGEGGGISVSPSMLIQQNVLGVSLHVFNQHTMLSGPATVHRGC